ncbi:uncharacterized protein LOC119172137 isoform X2 [Rhipicephalus microplus]|uniref:uncharacterized protein LOC119172137 isoform X2 n=1 Tax=Rhipicephalus microplus TaxID=6941 RepID=UPI003F6ADFA6
MSVFLWCSQLPNVLGNHSGNSLLGWARSVKAVEGVLYELQSIISHLPHGHVCHRAYLEWRAASSPAPRAATCNLTAGDARRGTCVTVLMWNGELSPHLLFERPLGTSLPEMTAGIRIDDIKLRESSWQADDKESTVAFSA